MIQLLKHYESGISESSFVFDKDQHRKSARTMNLATLGNLSTSQLGLMIKILAEMVNLETIITRQGLKGDNEGYWKI
jgi:hypothetical protein